MKKKFLLAILACSTTLLLACTSSKVVSQTEEKGSTETVKEEKLNIVATSFAPFDFARQVAGEDATVTMLLPPATEAHSYEPTPQDIMKIQESDIFIYAGGDSDEWVTDVLESIGSHETKVIKMMDCVPLVEEETVEGMEAHEHDHAHEHEAEEAHDHDHEAEEEHDHEVEEAHDHEHEAEEAHDHDHDHEAEEAHDHDHDHEAEEAHDHDHEAEEAHDHDHEAHEMDEHVWTSPKNAILIVKEIEKAAISLDKDHAKDYEAHATSYIEQLQELDEKFKEVVDNGKIREIIFADRFPLRYFADAYDLDYYAAFPGCATQAEASAATVAFLIDKVKKEHIPAVFHIELSNEKMADTVCEATGAKKLLFNACHNVTKEQFENGITYLEVMNQNVEALKEALNG